jgi:hypothetical protein
MYLTDKSLIDMAMAKSLFLYDAIVSHGPSRNMRALSAPRQREAGMGDDWARPVVH